MKFYRKIAVFTIGVILLSACDKDDGPSPDDNILNFEIPVIKATEDYPVGVYYFNPGSGGQDPVRYGRLNEEYIPSEEKIGPNVDLYFGNYKIDQDVNKITDEMIDIMQQHVDWCINGGVDFLILPALRAEKNKLTPECINPDYRFYDILRGVNPSSPNVGGSGKTVDMKSLKYILTINMEDPLCQSSWETYNADGTLTGSKTKTLSNTTLLENNNDIVAYIDEDGDGVGVAYTRRDMFKELFKSLSKYFKDDAYFRAGGKPVVLLQGAHRLYSKDCKAFYDEMRQAVREFNGEEMYIVARQDSWSPPARFEYFFKGVDAITHTNMYNQGDFNRGPLYPQVIYRNWEYSRNYFRDKWGGTDYIPTGAVAFSSYVDNASFDKPQVYFNGDVFRTMCNVMKGQAGNHKIVFIDSFNQIQYSSFLEPTKTDYGRGKGDLFLRIVKEEFDAQ